METRYLLAVSAGSFISREVTALWEMKVNLDYERTFIWIYEFNKYNLVWGYFAAHMSAIILAKSTHFECCRPLCVPRKHARCNSGNTDLGSTCKSMRSLRQIYISKLHFCVPSDYLGLFPLEVDLTCTRTHYVLRLVIECWTVFHLFILEYPYGFWPLLTSRLFHVFIDSKYI